MRWAKTEIILVKGGNGGSGNQLVETPGTSDIMSRFPRQCALETILIERLLLFQIEKSTGAQPIRFSHVADPGDGYFATTVDDLQGVAESLYCTNIIPGSCYSSIICLI